MRDDEEWEPPVRREWEDKVNAQDTWTEEDKANSQVYWTRERLLKRAARKGQFDDADKVYYKKKSKTRKHKHSSSWKKETLKKKFFPKIPDAGEAFKPDPNMQVF